MTEYIAINDNAPYFRWANNQIKARQGNLAKGTKVSGMVSGKFLIIPSGLTGEAPLPYAMYLIDLEAAPEEEEPPSEPEIEVDPNDVMIHQVGGIETERF